MNRRPSYSVTLAGDQRLSWTEFGVPQGRPLFFFHGWPGSGCQGAILDSAARRTGWRILAPDRPGLGGSSPQPGRRLADWPPVVASLANRLGLERFAVLGVSGGGPYALACAATLGDQVSLLGICCGALPLLDMDDHRGVLPAYRVLMHLHRRHPRWSVAVMSTARRVLLHLPSALLRFLVSLPLPAADRRALRDPVFFQSMRESLLEAFQQSAQAVIDDGLCLASRWPFQPSQIPVRTLLWHGALDRNMPLRLAREVLGTLPQANWRTYPWEGHYSLPFQRSHEILREMAETPS